MSTTANDTIRRLSRANTASGVGAALLGASVGVWFHDELLRYFLATLIVGLALHSVGMYDWHRTVRRSAAQPSFWMRALYVACWVSLAALAAYVAVRAPPSFAATSVERGQVARVNDLDIFYGVIPAEIIRGHPAEHPEASMHGGVPHGSGQHHLIVSIFDVRTAKRLENAQVSARVSEPGLAPQKRALEPMQFAGSITYGNFFNMSAAGPYRIDVEIRPHGQGPTNVTFEYRHPRR